jgi:glycolate oxidase FAD binding subunit
LNQILEELTGIAGPDRLKSDPAVAARFSVDGLTPKAVAFPTNTKMVADIVQCAARGGLSVLPRGSGTKMGMGNPPERLDLVVSMSRMNHMLDVDIANLTITVEAGVKIRDVQARLATEEDRCYLPLEEMAAEAGELICSERSHSGCFLPLDPPFSEKATIGGIVATNSSGPKRLLYGLPRDLVLGLRFVTPQGEIVGAGGKTVKNVSGYDVSKLLIGSQGSLGIICEATLRLLPLPESMGTLLFGFDRFQDAGGFAAAVLRTKLLPAAVEVVNRPALEGMEIRGIVDPGPGSTFVIIGLEACREAVARMAMELPALAKRFKLRGHTSVQEEKHRFLWLAAGELPSRLAARCSALVGLQLNYPLSDWERLYELAEQELSRAGLSHALLCHAGSGVCLIHVLLDAKAGSRTLLKEAAQVLMAECRKAGGNLVVQSAPADLKGSLPMWGEPGSDRMLMRRIREELDPSGLMSPGRFI